MSVGGGSLNCANQSINSLAQALESILNKPVINETMLTNSYDFQLLWNEKASGETDPAELGLALREQLGLKLAPAKREIELLVVTEVRGTDHSSSLIGSEKSGVIAHRN